MYFGATEKWHVQMVMVSRVVQLAGAPDAPPGTHVSNRGVYAGILGMPDIQSVCSQNQLSTRLACTAQVARLIQPYVVLILIDVLDITG